MRSLSRWLVLAVGALLVLAVAAAAMNLVTESVLTTSSATTGKTGAGPGTAIDMRPTTVDSLGTKGNVFRSALFIISVGVFADSAHSGKYTFSIEESDNNSDYTAVAAAALSGTAPVLVDSADGSQNYMVQYHGNSRYLRPNWTITAGPESSAVACPFGVLALQLDPKYPVE